MRAKTMDEKHRLNLRVEELGTRNSAMARCLKLAAFAAVRNRQAPKALVKLT